MLGNVESLVYVCAIINVTTSMQKLQSFIYEGSAITFDNVNGDVMVNATEMAKPFDKRTTHWLQNQNTKAFIEELSAVRNLTPTDLVKVINGGVEFGTWMHEDVALEFARWLNPRFAIWCNDRIKELLKHGATAMNPDDLLDPDFIITLATELKRERAEKALLSSRLEIQGRVIQEAAPKVAYYQEVLQSDSLIATTVIAKDLGMSASALNKILNQRGILYKCAGVWVLYEKYQDRGYSKTKTITYSDNQDVTRTVSHTYWTEMGREFIHGLLKQT